jgi:hypothetical protein
MWQGGHVCRCDEGFIKSGLTAFGGVRFLRAVLVETSRWSFLEQVSDLVERQPFHRCVRVITRSGMWLCASHRDCRGRQSDDAD